MDTLTLVIVLAALGLLVVLGGGLALVRGRRGRKAPLPPLTDLEESPGAATAHPSGDVRVLEPPTAVSVMMLDSGGSNAPWPSPPPPPQLLKAALASSNPRVLWTNFIVVLQGRTSIR